VTVKQLGNNDNSEVLHFGDIRFSQDFSSGDKPTADLVMVQENVSNFIKNCNKCTFVFNIENTVEKTNTASSLLKIDEKPKSFQFNLFVDEQNRVLSFNSLYSTMYPQDTVYTKKSGSASTGS